MTRKNIWSLLVMVALGVGISWYSLRNVKLSNLMDDILTLNWWWLLVALGCVGLYFGLEAVNLCSHFGTIALRVPCAFL